MCSVSQASVERMAPMDQIYHPVSTTIPEAQNYFNKGLTYTYAYNHDEAYQYFEKAAELDPNLAMAYWGMALALGQNVNTDVTKENEIKCYNLVQQALKLASNASKNEQDYIHAIKQRYTDDPTADLIPLRHHYRQTMKKVVEAYPEDLDAATLYSESILQLNPWKWWTYDGEPTEGVSEAAGVLESVLNRNPDHIGANHFYIHAIEESPYPERALMSANRLETLFHEAGHLLHMPCHIFLLVGDYESALKTNKKAIAADRQYIKEHGEEGNYPSHYLSHNLYIMTRIYMLMENFEKAYQTALELNEFIRPHVTANNHFERAVYAPLETLLYFHKWKEILEFQPIIKNSTIVNSYKHFSRSMAHASLGNLEESKKEKQLFLECKKNIPPSAEMANNPASKVFDLAELVLNASLARAQNAIPQSIDYLKQAIDMQDRLNYEEPPPWYDSIRGAYGATLIKEQRWTEATENFKQALTKLKRNGRLLFGLFLSLKGEQKKTDAFWVEREMTQALRSASAPLKLDDL